MSSEYLTSIESGGVSRRAVASPRGAFLDKQVDNCKHKQDYYANNAAYGDFIGELLLITPHIRC
jgi:hypothetical protein